MSSSFTFEMVRDDAECGVVECIFRAPGLDDGILVGIAREDFLADQRQAVARYVPEQVISRLVVGPEADDEFLSADQLGHVGVMSAQLRTKILSPVPPSARPTISVTEFK